MWPSCISVIIKSLSSTVNQSFYEYVKYTVFLSKAVHKSNVINYYYCLIFLIYLKILFLPCVVLEDDLSQSVKNGYLLLEDEIDHVRLISYQYNVMESKAY